MKRQTGRAHKGRGSSRSESAAGTRCPSQLGNPCELLSWTSASPCRRPQTHLQTTQSTGRKKQFTAHYNQHGVSLCASLWSAVSCTHDSTSLFKTITMIRLVTSPADNALRQIIIFQKYNIFLNKGKKQGTPIWPEARLKEWYKSMWASTAVCYEVSVTSAGEAKMNRTSYSSIIIQWSTKLLYEINIVPEIMLSYWTWTGLRLATG